ncbi:uncharacterized protein BO88DRAFT_90093 [Aspergillus vadensis CBS 113365]|uniref:Uncharacterized protein n=1 Tax=Aspergillus vadensis (strain CBS 113365 / IMI 142717 / IBT 24658) TaxID=1448311 RepID=A0A319B941_ASPVC|nr:hypothetical protein BO88DRAFT_90093 [Aspergillus vadensis CBS 113365]PYH66950.1 hypothetical protein BO88DRAFT_90093 [Aspergillus vadensis CBS 113365]
MVRIAAGIASARHPSDLFLRPVSPSSCGDARRDAEHGFIGRQTFSPTTNTVTQRVNPPRTGGRTIQSLFSLQHGTPGPFSCPQSCPLHVYHERPTADKPIGSNFHLSHLTAGQGARPMSRAELCRSLWVEGPARQLSIFRVLPAEPSTV